MDILWATALIAATVGAVPQSDWGSDYDYNSVMFPPYGGNPQFRQPMMAPPPMRPPAPMRSAMMSPPRPFGYRLPNASYRPALFNGAQQWIQMNQQTDSPKGDLDSLLARIVTRLPALAEQFGQFATTTQSPTLIPFVPTAHSVVTMSPPTLWTLFPTIPQTATVSSPNEWFKQPNSFGENIVVSKNDEIRRAPAVINSMPDPSTFFSFGKLLNAFTGSAIESQPSKAPNPDAEEYVDMDGLKGTPILKDEDEESEVVQKSDESLLPSVTAPSPKDSNSIETLTASPNPQTPNPTDGILGSLLSGQLDRIDWLGSIFGENSAKKSLLGSATEGEGNALAQLLNGGLFGSAMSDSTNSHHLPEAEDDGKIHKVFEHNFHR